MNALTAIKHNVFKVAWSEALTLKCQINRGSKETEKQKKFKILINKGGQNKWGEQKQAVIKHKLNYTQNYFALKNGHE